MYICVYIYLSIYLYIYLSLSINKKALGWDRILKSLFSTPSPPTKSSGFKGFDSSRLLILRGGNSHVRIIL